MTLLEDAAAIHAALGLPEAVKGVLPVAQAAAELMEAKIEKVRSRDGQAEALVVFVARKTRSTGWQPMWLQLANLRPLH